MYHIVFCAIILKIGGDFLKHEQGNNEVFSEKKLTYIFRVKTILFAIIIYVSTLYAILFSVTLSLTCFLFFISFVFLLLLGYVFISYKRKILILELQKLIFSCERDNNLWDLIRHYDSAVKKQKIAKFLLPLGIDYNTLKNYRQILIDKKQNFIRNAMIKHYEIIVERVKTKQIHISKKVCDGCKNFVNSVNFYSDIFDQNNTILSLSLLEKSKLIINFTEKYLNAYDIKNQYNIDLMKGQEFEKFCANILMAYGFEKITVTKGSGDQGVDIIGYYNGYKYAIQCKRYSKKLGNSPIQEVVAGKNFYNCQAAMVITNNYFTDGAIQLAKANNVEVWDRNDLMQVIYYTDSRWEELLEKIKNED